ncbi:hypothetical protein BGX28_003616 [Mortierella sp. GBA30]|nr:hypothetical protein BGX28_003616 [Mortierella sp. GBA30]
MPSASSVQRPKVLIVGAGIGGVTLAILLERAGVPYEVYERAEEVKPFGAAHYFGPNIAPLFQQIGVYEDFVANSKVCHSIDVFNERREPSFVFDFGPTKELGGSDGYIIARPVLYDILLKRVPPQKVHRSKKMLSIMQNKNGVMIRFMDGTSADGDILVGADGAYSAVRQSLYKQLQKAGKLPSSDGKTLPYSCICLVGQSAPFNPEKIPELKDEKCHFNNVLAQDRPYSWMTWTTKSNTLCYTVVLYLDKEASKENNSFRNSEWGNEAAQAMCNEVRDFPIPGGDGTLTLGDLIDNTPKQQITKVMLEEKVFDTWYHGRTVLIGDACHKVHPAGGQGALLAVHDAVALANWLNTLYTTSPENIEMAFNEYKTERIRYAKDAYVLSSVMASVSATNFKAKVTRFVMKNMPTWLNRLVQVKNAANRPQASFLPLIQDNGSVKAKAQPSLQKTLALVSAKESSDTLKVMDEAAGLPISNFTMPAEHTPSTLKSRPKVLIVGAGLGGLTLALLLERAGVPYEIFERAAVVKPLGSAISLTANTASLFRQLGIYDEFTAAGLVYNQVMMYDEDLNLEHVMDFTLSPSMGGDPGYIIARPALYDILNRRIPQEKVHMSKRVLNVREREDCIRIECSDNTMYEGDILVGADGAYSGVRQGLYKILRKEGKLPSSDDIALPYSMISLVGQTQPLDPEQFPELKEPTCIFNNMNGAGTPFTWVTFTTKDNTICFMVVNHLTKYTSKDHDSFRNSEWGPEAADAMCNEVRHFPIPNGGKPTILGTLIDLTPKNLISKVTLEEKVFDTWYSGRSVLLGDSCHKLSPSGGVGATSAMHDALCLANWINILPGKPTKEDTERIFKEYRAERLPVAQENYRASQFFTKINEKTWGGALARYVRNNMPLWMWRMVLKRLAMQRPQAAFLPSVPDTGKVERAAQPSLTKTQAILAARKAAKLQ